MELKAGTRCPYCGTDDPGLSCSRCGKMTCDPESLIRAFAGTDGAAKLMRGDIRADDARTGETATGDHAPSLRQHSPDMRHQISAIVNGAMARARCGDEVFALDVADAILRLIP